MILSVLDTVRSCFITTVRSFLVVSAFIMGGLDHGHQSHVAVRRNSDAAQQLRCQTGGDKDGSRAVCTADDGDCSGLLLGEIHNAGSSQQTSAHVSAKDTELSGSAQQQALGVGDQRAKSVMVPMPRKISGGKCPA